MIIVALLLALLETGLLSSNAIGFFAPATEAPIKTDLGDAPLMPSVSHLYPEINAIDHLLTRFGIDETRRKRVSEAIVRSSRKHDIDPRLVASVMLVESRGNAFAISSSNAVGIMQIHVPTWAHKVDEESINLFKVEDNVDFGVRILKDYLQRYGRDEGIKRYNGWNPNDPKSTTAEAYFQKVQRIYSSASLD